MVTEVETKTLVGLQSVAAVRQHIVQELKQLDSEVELHKANLQRALGATIVYRELLAKLPSAQDSSNSKGD